MINLVTYQKSVVQNEPLMPSTRGRQILSTPLFQDRSSYNQRFSVATSEICGGDQIGHHQLSQHRINGQKLSVDFRYCGAGRFDQHHVMLLESTSTVQFEQLIWQMPICGGSKRCGQKMTAPHHQRKHQRVKTAL